jgi:hypothetical protein
LVANQKNLGHVRLLKVNERKKMKKLFRGHSVENQLLDNPKLLKVFSRFLKKIAEIKSVLTFEFPFPLPLKRRLLTKFLIR